MKILIVNQPLNNRGDESAHKALVRTLVREFPTAEVSVLWVNANPNSIMQFSINDNRVSYINIKGRKGISGFTKIALKTGHFWMLYLHPTTYKLIHIYKVYDWVITAPGGICMGGFQNWNHLLMLQIARMTKKKMIYYGRSFGPFPEETSDNRRFKQLSMDMLNYFSFFSIRDYKSELLAQKMGVSYIPTVDTAFLDSPKVEIPNELKEYTAAPYVVFVPNLLIWHYAFKDKLSKVDVINFYKSIIRIIEEKYACNRIIMLPQTFNYGTYNGDDIHFFYELKDSVGDCNISVIPDTYSSDIQQAIISGANCVIGARYHSVVFALNNAVPFVALSYEHKISGLVESLDKKSCMVDISNLSPQNFDEKIREFEKALGEAYADVKAQKVAKQIANNCFDKLKNMMYVDSFQNSSQELRRKITPYHSGSVTFSVTVPAYKSQFLAECIESILSQTYSEFELIIVDDASPEDLKSIVSRYNDDRIRYYKNERGYGAVNVVGNWNKCLEYSHGDFVICMGDDDRLMPTCLEQYNYLIDKYPNLDVYHARFELIDEKSQRHYVNYVDKRDEYESTFDLLANRFKGRYQFIGDHLFRTSTLREKGGFVDLPCAWFSDEISIAHSAGTKGIASTPEVAFQYRVNRSTISNSSNLSKFKIEASNIAEIWYENFINCNSTFCKQERDVLMSLMRKRIIRVKNDCMSYDMSYNLIVGWYKWRKETSILQLLNNWFYGVRLRIGRLYNRIAR
jgi:colanic acid/amylovoran biosynthesis protein